MTSRTVPNDARAIKYKAAVIIKPHLVARQTKLPEAKHWTTEAVSIEHTSRNLPTTSGTSISATTHVVKFIKAEWLNVPWSAYWDKSHLLAYKTRKDLHYKVHLQHFKRLSQQ